MFERYTSKARRVIFFAREEAALRRSSEIETEHLLLALIRVDPQTRKILGESGASVVRERVEAAYPQPLRAVAPSADIPLSYESGHVLAYAAEEAERLGDPRIRAPHLLLGLLREPRGLAARILAELKVSLEQARTVTTETKPMDISELHTAALVWAGSMTQPLAAHHLLLALLDDQKSPVAQFLNEHGITTDSVCGRFGETPS